MIFKLHISLDYTDPLVWRRLLVPSANFSQLHWIIQHAFGWENSHLYEFTIVQDGESVSIGPPNEEFPDVVAAAKVPLRKYLTKPGQEVSYLYDFGDSWEHTIKLEEISRHSLKVPLCIDGGGACPPEDIGAIPGYYEWVEAVNDPKHPEHQEMREWHGMKRGAKWDVAHFDVIEPNARLQ
ncbi:MAG: plasmid pRiA4b ORF-3 family protein [Bacteroidia bacterium]